MVNDDGDVDANGDGMDDGEHCFLNAVTLGAPSFPCYLPWMGFLHEWVLKMEWLAVSLLTLLYELDRHPNCPN